MREKKSGEMERKKVQSLAFNLCKKTKSESTNVEMRKEPNPCGKERAGNDGKKPLVPEKRALADEIVCPVMVVVVTMDSQKKRQALEERGWVFYIIR